MYSHAEVLVFPFNNCQSLTPSTTSVSGCAFHDCLQRPAIVPSTRGRQWIKLLTRVDLRPQFEFSLQRRSKDEDRPRKLVIGDDFDIGNLFVHLLVHLVIACMYQATLWSTNYDQWQTTLLDGFFTIRFFCQKYRTIICNSLCRFSRTSA